MQLSQGERDALLTLLQHEIDYVTREVEAMEGTLAESEARARLTRWENLYNKLNS